jgi:hypothetical protein
MINESAIIMQFACDYAAEKGLKLWPHEASPGDLSAGIKTGKHKLEMQNHTNII